MKAELRASETQEGVNVVQLSGRFGAEEAEQLGEILSEALAKSADGLILDMAEVSFISSAGLRVLVQSRKSADEVGKTVAMIHVQPAVYKIFKLTAFEKVVGVFDNERQALKAMAK